ncbi:hypothetical protein FY134_10200 [Agrobacterium fabrum]|uniref:hypothetical protein n=1 Tax=Agrobacterium fabrum TaxID=1176649 RepID=UPI000DD02AE7|nr:hypothetical protein [Agrobacterium fabrum]UXT57998.1 hypothetical protein FY134_10200 [Agrobacterium fabrum]
MISDERKHEFEAAIRRDIPRNALVEVKTLFPRAAEQADIAVSTSHKAVVDGLPLSRYRQSRSVGLIRHNIIDEAFEQILARNGAEFVKSVPVDYTPDEMALAPVHLTTGVFGHTMVGFASHRELHDTPVKNASRRALCYQNRGLSPDFFHPPEMFSDRQRMVIIMVRRDPNVLGKIASLTLSVVDSKQETFIYQAEIDEFLAGYGAEGASPVKRPVVLKPVKGGFKDTNGEESRDVDEK